MKWMKRLRGLGALGVAVCVVAEYSDDDNHNDR
jgi:hypothetical protein